MALSRTDVLQHADDFPTKEIPVPEWGGDLRIRCLNVKDRLRWAHALSNAAEGKPDADPTALLVVLAAVDDQGKRIFTEQDSDALAEMRGDLLDRLAKEVMDLSGIGDTAVEDAKGNSDATQASDSPSESADESAAPSGS